MTLHILVEGPSERALLERWAPRLLSGERLRVHPHQGKGRLPDDLAAFPDPKRRGLLDQLPATLRGFADSLDAATDGVVVLVDADDDDSDELAASVNEAVQTLGSPLKVAVRLAIEETEAFYLGDLKALEKAFSDADMNSARAYAPDSVCGTWELFGKIVGDGGGNKVAWAERMGPLLTTRAGESRSPSFRKFVEALLSLVPARPATAKRRAYHHQPKKRRAGGKRS